MTGKFYVITFNCGVRLVPNEAIERALGIGHDWLRFSPHCYYAYATVDAGVLYSVIRPLLHPEDLILVSEINPENRFGWVSQVAVEWLARSRA